MATKAGNLQVSVVEGKGLKPAGNGTTADPYVKLTLGTQEVKTEALRGTLAPKWVKDFKLPVPITKPNLTVTIGDEASPEDIGSTTIQISDIIAAGTTVHWYKVFNAAGTETGEVCLVLRFIAPKGDGVRSPSGSIASSDGARSPRASVSLDGAANGNGTTGGPQLLVSPSVKEAIRKIEENDPSGAEKLTQIATRDPPKEPGLTQEVVRREIPTDPSVLTDEPLTQGVVRRELPTDPSVLLDEPERDYKAPPPPSMRYQHHVNGAKEDVRPKPANRSGKKKGGNPIGSILGVLVAVAAGAFVVANSKRKPKFYEVKEGDTLCSIAGCFRLSVDELYDNNAEVTADPDRIYPGDRFYIP